MDIDWCQTFQRLAAEYGWHPAQIAELTPAQVTAYLDTAPSGGVCWMTPAEVRAWRSRQNSQES